MIVVRIGHRIRGRGVQLTVMRLAVLRLVVMLCRVPITARPASPGRSAGTPVRSGKSLVALAIASNTAGDVSDSVRFATARSGQDLFAEREPGRVGPADPPAHAARVLEPEGRARAASAALGRSRYAGSAGAPITR